MNRRTKLAGYELFLPALTAIVREKEKRDDQLSDAEFKALIAVIFRDTLIAFTKETHLYRIDIPIDLYAEVDRYELFAPTGFFIDASMGLKTGKAHIPSSYVLDEHELVLGCCPKADIDKALYVEVALVPDVTNMNCLFEASFLSRYYDAILAGMEMRLFGMVRRTWYAVQMFRLKEHEYRKLRNRAARGGTDASRPIGIKYKRLTDAM